MSTGIYINSNIFLKFINLFVKQGKKEKVENCLLNFLKVYNFCLFYEIIYKFDIGYRFYSKRRRKGRRSFIYFNSLVKISNGLYLEKCVFYFSKLIYCLFSKNPKKKLSIKTLSTIFLSFIKFNFNEINVKSVDLQKEVLFLKPFWWRLKYSRPKNNRYNWWNTKKKLLKKNKQKKYFKK